jgi:4-amino-4-deoxy-L-arabinose transferase-like glycosyltransferase
MVRLPSALCWVVGTCLLYALGRRLWPSAASRIFLLLSLAFTPSLFCLSRIAFEVIALYPLLALFLYALYRGFERGSVAWAAIAGLAIGTSTYAYTTFRLLAPLHCLLVLVCYGKRAYWRSLAGFAAAAFCAVLPFAWYLHFHGEHLTKRYQEVSGYVAQPLPFGDKLKLFTERYVGYFDAEYLLLHGDGNTRHHTGYGGELFLPTLIGVALAIALFVLDSRRRKLRFTWVLLGGLLLSPIAGALTRDHHHSLRGFSLVVFAVLLSVSGFHYALRRAPAIFPALVAASVAIYGALFVQDYYGPYVAKSIQAFEHYGFRDAVAKAQRAGATRIVVDDRRKSRHADLHANFLLVVLTKEGVEPLPSLVAGHPRAVRPGEFLIFQDLKGAYPDLHEGLPEGSLYVASPYGRMVLPPSRPRKR